MKIKSLKVDEKKLPQNLVVSIQSVLLELPYFDAPRMNIVDPMHNLFLGSAKHIFKKVFIACLLLDRGIMVSWEACLDLLRYNL